MHEVVISSPGHSQFSSSKWSGEDSIVDARMHKITVTSRTVATLRDRITALTKQCSRVANVQISANLHVITHECACTKVRQVKMAACWVCRAEWFNVLRQDFESSLKHMDRPIDIEQNL